MKIDSHQHYWQYNDHDFGWIDENMSAIKRNFSPVDLAPELEKISFDGSIAVQARQSLEETNWLLQLATENPHIKGVVGWADLCSLDAEQQIAQFAKYEKAVGVRHVIHDEVDDDFILKPEFIRGVQFLEKYDLAYDILIFPKHLPNTIKFVHQFPEKQRFVIDHIAKPLIKDQIYSPWKEDLQALAKYPNVYCKLSGMVTEANWQNWSHNDLRVYLQIVLDCFGSDRLMIGSDWPVCLLAGSYTKVMNVVQEFISNLSSTEQIKILGKNAVKAYKLKG